MPERPLLILPDPGQPATRRKKSGGGGRLHYPTRERQTDRLTPRFRALEEAFEKRRARLQVEAAGLVPEEVLVLETVGPVENLIVAVNRVPGMEWLGEIDKEEIPPDDDFFALDSKGERRLGKPVSGRVFLIFSNQDALTQLLSLWNRWKAGESLPYGYGKWKNLLGQLRNIRPWGIHDRLLETGLLGDWRERVEHNAEIVPCEIELWFRENSDQRQSARDRVVTLAIDQGGQVLHEAIIEEIAYQALLVSLPVAAVRTLLEGTGTEAALVQCEQIQFFRATGQMAGIVRDDGRTNDDGEILETQEPLNNPVIALLDGLPLQNHRRLAGRLIVDDPDGIESRYQAHERRHGTAMASLIVHGDLNGHEEALSKQLYVRPILQPDSRDWRRAREETVPENRLVVDLIHRAVRRLLEGEGSEPAVAPNVCVVNLSIGIRDRLFEGSLSPLARLLDWLAWKYQVFFIVSAGNHPHSIELAVARNALSSLTPQEIEEHIIRAVASDARHRRLLSPAEAVNVLTVGALHDDRSGGIGPPRSVTPFVSMGLPSPINAQGMGYRRAIKPEILAPGGKVVLQEGINSNPQANFSTYRGSLAPGQMVAAPGTTAGELDAAWYTRGTSNATALTSRAAGILYDIVDELTEEPGGTLIDSIPRAIWLKGLLIHAAEWGAAGEIFERILRTPQNSRQFKEYVTRLLGYGGVHVLRVRECTAYRATALSGGNLAADEAHIHRFPLPPSMSGIRGRRRLIITLAWLTPVNPRHQGWRRAALWFEPPRDILRLSRQQAHWQAVQRGTVQHEVLEGDRASAFVDGDNLEIQVSCRADAGTLEETVPYALVTTLEIAEEVGVPIYDEIRVRVHARVRVSPAT